MYTKADIINDIKKAGIMPDDTVFMHTSLKSVGELENGADTILDAFCEYLSEGLFVLPTHTWNNINTENPHYYQEETKVCIGILPDIFRKRSGVYRSLHPTHSVAAFGKDAEEFVKGDENIHTPCGVKSCYGKLHKRNAKIVMLGVNLARCTIIHCIEELAMIPGKIKQDSEDFFIHDKEGNVITLPSYRHYGANSETFIKLQPLLRHRGELSYNKLGDADMLIISAQKLFKTTLELLDRDEFLFNDDKPIKREWY